MAVRPRQHGAIASVGVDVWDDNRYDDQQDYFDLNDKWNGGKVSGDAYKPVYVERSKVDIVSGNDV